MFEVRSEIKEFSLEPCNKTHVKEFERINKYNNMTKFERIVERLKKEPFLSDFTFRKSDSSFIQKFDGGFNRIQLDHCNKLICIIVLPDFDVKFDIASKWFEKFSFKTLRDQRHNSTVGASSGMLGFKIDYEFENSQKNFDKEYAALVNCLKKALKKFSPDMPLLKVFINMTLFLFLKVKKR